MGDIARYPWPTPRIPASRAGCVRRRSGAYRPRTTPLSCTSRTSLHTTQYLRGFEPWYWTWRYNRSGGARMDAVGRFDGDCAPRRSRGGRPDRRVSTADDVAISGRPQMSLRHYRKLIKPRHARYMAQSRDDGRHDSDLTPVALWWTCMPDFIDMGIQAINRCR